jgi:hypothetical protein
MEKPEQPKQNSRDWRILGKVSKENKDTIKKSFNRALFEHLGSFTDEEREELKKMEFVKTPEQIHLIELANKETNALMERLGFSPIDISSDNVHVVSEEVFRKKGKGDASAVALYEEQAIVMKVSDFDRVIGTSSFFSTVFHEMMHLKSHMSLEVSDAGRNNLDVTFFRTGVTAHSSQAKNKELLQHKHFNGLHEAIVALAEQKEFKKIMEREDFEEERRWLETDFAKSVKDDARAVKDKEAVTVERKEVVIDGIPRTKIYAKDISYTRQKEVLKYLMEQIQKDNEAEFSSEDSVFDVFLDAHFSGRLLKIAKLIERSFGEGSFRSLGGMTNIKESAITTLETFKNLRAKVLREREKNTK